MRRIAAIQTDAHARFFYLDVPSVTSAKLSEIGRRFATELKGQADDADHITLCFVPKAEAELTAAEAAIVVDVVAGALADFQPIDVWIGGFAYFDTAEGKNGPATALVALIDGPGLTELHMTVAAALRDLGWAWEPTHVFIAHTTLAYLPQGVRVDDLPVVEDAWTVREVCFANSTIERIPLAGKPRIAFLLRAGIPGLVRQADLQGGEMLRWRTSPDQGNGPLFPYCSDCANLAMTDRPGVLGCRKGDDPDVVDYGERLDRGETTVDVERCPLYTPKEAPVDDSVLIQASRARWKQAQDVVPMRFLIWHAEPGCCQRCENLDGEVLSEDELVGARALPGQIHAGCKCTGEPVGWAEAVRRDAGMVKDVPGQAVGAGDEASDLDDLWPAEEHDRA